MATADRLPDGVLNQPVGSPPTELILTETGWVPLRTALLITT